MKSSLKLKILLAVLGLQSAWIVGTTVIQERALWRGERILLETRPVDPRDLLRGDYVILSYKISDVPLQLFRPAIRETLPPGRTVYVALAPRDRFYEVARASTERLSPARGEVVLKGRSEYWWNSTQQRTVRVAYGLERYYVREGTGNPSGKITVEVAVPASGQGVIRQVFVDGQPYAEAMRASAR